MPSHCSLFVSFQFRSWLHVYADLLQHYSRLGPGLDHNAFDIRFLPLPTDELSPTVGADKIGSRRRLHHANVNKGLRAKGESYPDWSNCLVHTQYRSLPKLPTIRPRPLPTPYCWHWVMLMDRSGIFSLASFCSSLALGTGCLQQAPIPHKGMLGKISRTAYIPPFSRSLY